MARSRSEFARASEDLPIMGVAAVGAEVVCLEPVTSKASPQRCIVRTVSGFLYVTTSPK